MYKFHEEKNQDATSSNKKNWSFLVYKFFVGEKTLGLIIYAWRVSTGVANCAKLVSNARSQGKKR